MNTFIEKPGSFREQQRQATRARLLAAARELFVERGYAAATLRDVAERAKVAVGTVFVHFPDKSALLAASLDDELERTLRAAFSRLPKKPPLDRLLHLARALYRMYARAPALSRELVSQSLFLQGAGAPLARERLDAFLGAITAMVAEPGALRPGLDAKAAAGAFFAGYLACLVEGLQVDRFDVEAQVERLARLLTAWFPPQSGRRTR